jgi:hypothetical protein
MQAQLGSEEYAGSKKEGRYITRNLELEGRFVEKSSADSTKPAWVRLFLVRGTA